MKIRSEQTIETQYACEQCGTIHLRHRLIMIGNTVAREKYWAVDRLHCCGQNMELRVVTFNMLGPTKCYSCANKACPYPTDAEYGAQAAKSATWQKDKDCWVAFEVVT